MDPRLMPPTQVQFTTVAIADIEATSFIRDGLTIRAWFDLPSQMSPGNYDLAITFPGREGEPITFTFPMRIQ